MDSTTCPVSEVARNELEDGTLALMLKIDSDATLYANNGLTKRIPGDYIQIMFAEVDDASVMQADNGIFYSFEITDIAAKVCPVTDGDGIYNTRGGGGIRDSLFTDSDVIYNERLEDECDALGNAALPVNYRQISFDASVWEDFNEQEVIRGDYISFGFVFTDHVIATAHNEAVKQVGW